MEPVEVLVSVSHRPWVGGWGQGWVGLERQIKQQGVLFNLHTGEREGDNGSGDDTQIGEEEVCFWSSYTS